MEVVTSVGECRKQAYYTQTSAYRAMTRIIHNATNGPVPVRIYWCGDHEGWHLTSQPKTAKYAHKEKGFRRG